MKFSSPVFQSILLSLSFAYVEAFWRMVCGTIQTGRIDPIISPGAISGHCHTIAGPINLNTTSTYATLQDAYCTSCSVQADKSGYWTPQMYYRHRNGSYEYVQHDGTVVYYLGRGTNQSNIVPFPPGLRMLSGDSGARAYDPDTLTYENGEPISNRVSFACLDYEPIPETPYMVQVNCSDGLRAQIQFQSCWDGVNLYKSDQSHVAYLSQIDNGDCPPGYPYLFPHLFYEVLYAVNNVDQSDGGYFVFSNGDTTGFGFHGDFINGWNEAVLTQAIAECVNNDNSAVEDCPALAPSVDPYFNINCPEQPPQINETVEGLLKALPGCNPPTGGSIRAAQNICPVQPKYNYVPDTDNYVRYVAKPGDVRANFTYLGCLNDNQTSRPLTGEFFQNSSMTIELCTAYCHATLFPLAGLEFGDQCFCGTSIPVSNPILSATTCGLYSYEVCSGNGLEYCGAPQLMQVWNDTNYVGPMVEPPPTPGTTTLTYSLGMAVYAGCYSDGPDRALSGYHYANSTGMTLEQCASTCNSYNTSYFGTEYADECYCGDSITSARIGEGNCTMACSGEKVEYCGAGFVLSVWSL